MKYFKVKQLKLIYTCLMLIALSACGPGFNPNLISLLSPGDKPAASSAEETIATEEFTDELPIDPVDPAFEGTPDESPNYTETLPKDPAEAVTEAPTEAPVVPILTGDVTYCDIVSRSVNLRLVEGFSAEEFNHQVTIGGEAMSCKVNEGNATLLTCTFPATTKFPASIQVSKDGNVVNEFDYDGSNCVVPREQAVPKDSSDGDSSSGSDCWDLYVPFGLCIPKP